jgi:hypothetical protein
LLLIKGVVPNILLDIPRAKGFLCSLIVLCAKALRGKKKKKKEFYFVILFSMSEIWVY